MDNSEEKPSLGDSEQAHLAHHICQGIAIVEGSNEAWRLDVIMVKRMVTGLNAPALVALLADLERLYDMNISELQRIAKKAQALIPPPDPLLLHAPPS